MYRLFVAAVRRAKREIKSGKGAARLSRQDLLDLVLRNSQSKRGGASEQKIKAFLSEGFALRGLSRQDMYSLYIQELKEGNEDSVLSGAGKTQALAISARVGATGDGRSAFELAAPVSSRTRPLHFGRASKASQILSYEHLKHLAPHVPVANRIKSLKLVFSTEEHGMSLSLSLSLSPSFPLLDSSNLPPDD